MKDMIREELFTPVTKECDVLVCGGGFAGIAAALAAARSGKRVILTEYLYTLGGLGTSGLVTIYLPLCDGYGKQVSFGLAEELLKLSVSIVRYPDRGTPNWLCADDPARRTEKDPRYEVEFNPHMFAVSVEQLLLSEGVEILYGTKCVAADCADGRVNAVVMENKSGRFAVRAGSFVDATGDADIGVFAGAPTVLCGVGNKVSAWYYYYANGMKKLRMMDFLEAEPDEAAIPVKLRMPEGRKLLGVDGDEISEFMELSHMSMLSDILRKRKTGPDYEPVTMTTMPEYRMTRRVDGAYTQRKTESHVRFEDSIGMVSNWRKRGPVYEVPFGSLYSPRVKNLIFAGRCTSMDDDLWELMRVIPCCSVTGEAAGVAAAMTDDLPALDIAALQKELRRRGVVLHEDDLENKAMYTEDGTKIR